MKRILFFLNFMFCAFSLGMSQSQSIQIVDSPVNFSNSGRGYFTDPIEIEGKLYMRYIGNDGNYDLFKYDPSTSTLTEISSPAGFDAVSAGYDTPSGDLRSIVLNGNLYMRYRGNDGNRDLFEYNPSTNTLTEITSPAGFGGNNSGYLGEPIVVDGKLYMRYQGDDGNGVLFEYNPSITTLTEISSPAGYTGTFRGLSSDPIELGGKLYLKYTRDDSNKSLFEYDPSTNSLTEISNPLGYTSPFYGYIDNPIVVQGKLYMRYQGDDRNYDLFEYDPSTTTLTAISSPVGFTDINDGYIGTPFEVNGKLYMRYRGNDGNFDLFEFDPSSSTLTEISSPVDFTNSTRGYWGDPIELDGKLYLRYRKNVNYYSLFEFDPSTNILSEINTPSGFTGSNRGYSGSNPIVMGNKLYLRYQGDDQNFDLFEYNPSTSSLTEISSPTNFDGAGRGYYDFPVAGSTWDDPVVIGDKLYLRYVNNIGNYSLFEYNQTNNTLTELSNPNGYTSNGSGYFARSIVIDSTLYMMFVGDDGNRDLAFLGESLCATTATITAPEFLLLCNPETSTLTVDFDGEVDSMQWFKNDMPLFSATTASITVNRWSIGTYKAQGYCSGDTLESNTILVNKPIALNENGENAHYNKVCLNDTTTLTASELAGATYEWRERPLGNLVSTDRAYSFTGFSGTLDVFVTSPSGCTKSAKVRVLPENEGNCEEEEIGVGIAKDATVEAENSLDQMINNSHVVLNFYPNPVSDFYSIQLEGLGQDEVFTVSWFDLAGRQVSRSTQVSTGAGTEVRKSIDGLSSGMYIIQVNNPNHQFNFKVMVK